MSYQNLKQILKILNKFHFLFFIIILLAIVLRLMFIESRQLNIDEISLCYDSYSLLKTGMDRFGYSFPIHFYSFGSGENIILSYILIPFISVFGLNTFAVRIPILIFSVLTIIITYFLTRELFNKKIALLSIFLLAVSPWHIYISNTAFNASLLPFFYTAIIYFLIKFFKHNKNAYLYFSTILSVLTFYIYSLSFIWVPIIYCFVFFLYKDQFTVRKRIIFLNLFFLIVLTAPITFFYFQNQFHLFQHIKNINFISFPELEKTRFDMVIPYNAPILFILNFILRYFLHIIIFPFTIIKGDYNTLTNIGIYLFEIPLLFFGIKKIIQNYKREKKYRLLLYWFFLAPIPVCFTLLGDGDPSIIHYLRDINFIPLLMIILAIGFYEILKYFKKNKFYKFKIILAVFTILLNIVIFFIFYNNNFVIDPRIETVKFIMNNQYRYDKIIISDDLHYIFFLFYLKMDPNICQVSNLKNFSKKKIYLGKYEFDKNQNIKIVNNNLKSLYIVNNKKIGGKIIKKFSNQYFRIRIIEN